MVSCSNIILQGLYEKEKNNMLENLLLLAKHQTKKDKKTYRSTKAYVFI